MIQNEFYVACGNTVFKRFLHEFDNVNDDYLNYIKEINDPILRHISLYLVQYYIDGHYYYSYSHSSHKNGACDYLKRWLLERKDLFTYGEKCPTKMKLWQDHVEPLWDKLEKGYPIQNHGGISWCKNEYPISQKTEYPHVLRSLNCEECTSKESSSAQCPPPSVQTQSTCRPCPVYVSSPETVPPQEAGHPPKTDQLSGTDRTKNLAVTSGFTAVGTLGTLFFLYRVIYKQ
ncbi:hypothetical protein PVIIG_04391 [Plasmodium vivax India VII]|uniref:Uncharacterized protein n=1 Tax=Plasmodium vivax India VII TaxID=1077284 RepID=A0A0J9SD56_PLAVI|nr:hypothetical protein PVIIG_04391 [Plasmodium vivax India VII]